MSVLIGDRLQGWMYSRNVAAYNTLIRNVDAYNLPRRNVDPYTALRFLQQTGVERSAWESGEATGTLMCLEIATWFSKALTDNIDSRAYVSDCYQWFIIIM